MPVTHVSKVFAVKDCKVAKVTADVSGGTTTYATSIDVPGIKQVKIEGDVETKSLRGDNSLLDSDTVLTNVSATLQHAKISLDALAMMLSQTVTDSGTTPNQKAVLDIFGGSAAGAVVIAPFKLSAISATADPVAGNVGFELWKCVLASFPGMGLDEEDYRIGDFKVNAMPRLSDGKWLSPSINETALVLT
jgi:hypothetical protein